MNPSVNVATILSVSIVAYTTKAISVFAAKKSSDIFVFGAAKHMPKPLVHRSIASSMSIVLLRMSSVYERTAARYRLSSQRTVLTSAPLRLGRKNPVNTASVCMRQKADRWR